MWILLGIFFILGLCAIIANIIDCIGTVLKYIIGPIILILIFGFIILLIINPTF